MSLQLAPRTENLLQEYAAREGVNVDEAIIRLVQAATASKRPATVDNPLLRLLQAQLREAEIATPEEVAAADEKYRKWRQAMNEPRRRNGERLLFPEIEP